MTRNPEGDDLAILAALSTGPLARTALYARASLPAPRARASVARLLARQRITTEVQPGARGAAPTVLLRIRDA